MLGLLDGEWGSMRARVNAASYRSRLSGRSIAARLLAAVSIALAGCGSGQNAAPAPSYSVTGIAMFQPTALALDPVLKQGYIGNQSELQVLDASTNTLQAPIETGLKSTISTAANGVVVDEETHTAYVANLGYNIIAVVDLTTDRVLSADCDQFVAAPRDLELTGSPRVRCGGRRGLRSAGGR